MTAPAPLHRIRRLGTRVLAAAEQTAGAYSLLEHTLEPGYAALPLHRHGAATTTLHVVAGRLRVRIGDATRDLGPGDAVTVPPGTWHTVWNPRPADPAERDGLAPGERATYLAVVAPGGVEAMYAAAAAQVRGADGPIRDVRAILAAAAAAGVEVRMESLNDLVERERVRLA